MSRVDFSSKLAGEAINEVFDFLSRLAVGETILSATCVASVYSGTDAAPQDLLGGSPLVVGSKVSQRIVGGVLGVTYELVCGATTSASQLLELSAFLCIVPDSQ